VGGEQLDELKTGDVVTVQEEPFRGYQAILDAYLSGEARVRVYEVFEQPQVLVELLETDPAQKTVITFGLARPGFVTVP